MMRRMIGLGLSGIVAGLLGCGDLLDDVEGLASCSVTPCPADTPFVLVAILECDDPCIEPRADDASCDVEVDVENFEITIDPKIPFDDDSTCFGGGCEGGVFVECPIDPLEPGQYEVIDDGSDFRGGITVE
ncbi:MAG: hypothetical protein ACFB9M_10735 [Myxococcota bacterium]